MALAVGPEKQDEVSLLFFSAATSGFVFGPTIFGDWHLTLIPENLGEPNASLSVHLTRGNERIHLARIRLNSVQESMAALLRVVKSRDELIGVVGENTLFIRSSELRVSREDLAHTEGSDEKRVVLRADTVVRQARALRPVAAKEFPFDKMANKELAQGANGSGTPDGTVSVVYREKSRDWVIMDFRGLLSLGRLFGLDKIPPMVPAQEKEEKLRTMDNALRKLVADSEPSGQVAGATGEEE
jgi:hypothetical protein